MRDNRGFTLIELIVVMLIMAILAVGGMAGYNLLNSGSAKHAADRVLSVLSSVQIDNMTKSKDYKMEISKDASGDYILSVYYMASGVRKNVLAEKLDLKNGQVTFKNNNGDEVTVNSSSKVEVSFRKDTGGIKPYNAGGDIVTQIGITSSGATCYIRLVTATGKHFVE